ncbi:hypothetical protein ABGB12_03610 [Actinocorallia sp. B10E7]|uniref:hypothetical protein n=1 Tax=Actinocorallia sp. B10E7 TaxID=3153558 RepID=UPI00325E0AD3
MNNAARHVLGFGVGVLALPALVALLCYGIVEFAQVYREMGETSPLAFVAVGAGGALLGLLCGSRLSPLASLFPGLVLFAYGVVWTFDPYVVSGYVTDVLPEGMRFGLLALESTGMLLVLGCALLVASAPPSRWRAMPKPPPVPYPQLPFATPGQPGAGSPPPADGPQAPPLPYQPGT